MSLRRERERVRESEDGRECAIRDPDMEGELKKRDN